MAPEETCKILLSQFGEEAIVSTVLDARRPFVQVTAEHWPAMALFLRDDERCKFNVLRSVTALDLLAEDRLACIYDLLHVRTERPTELIESAHEFAVRVEVDRNDPVIASVAHVWPAADWHEREAFDLMGIRFSDHPDLRRILCPDDWVGHPLRKDYDFPLEYHGIPGTTEYGLTNPRH